MVKKQYDNGEAASYYFHQGTTTYAYMYLGAHKSVNHGTSTWTFRVWAPTAQSVSVVGDFNNWNKDSSEFLMHRCTDMGVWECVAQVPSGEDWEGYRYKYCISGSNGVHLKADPYAFYSETCGKTASILHTFSGFRWEDSNYRAKRKRTFAHKDERPFYCAPMNIYELHLGSFRTRDGQSTANNPDAYLSYRELADILVPYLTEMGYTHVELLPVMEHPFDGSWGYQVCGYYSPTSRYGTPEDFKYFVNTLHKSGIGVILDWVPAHFPKDENGLYKFDGQRCYEYQGDDRVEHSGWGTRCFDVGRNEVQSFLISNALFWLREYHADGLRVDAVAAMLYLDFDKKPGEWIPAPDGSNRNPEAIAFLKKLNGTVLGEFPDVLMIAEESTAWPMITKPTHEGGLGFNFKWNMGWANDMFTYIGTDPIYRKYIHDKLTFPLTYAFSENYILPVSHDEVVHGKKSLLDKMYGNYEEKFASFRTFLAYMMTQPGKKMLFMGTEFAPFREWDYENQLEWFMLDYDKHKQSQTFTAALNHFYLDNAPLWEDDFSWDGYRWINVDERDTNTIAYARFDRKVNPLLIAVNFAPVTRENYTLRIEDDMPECYTEVFSTDEKEFGGYGTKNKGILQAISDTDNNAKFISITLPSLSAVILAPYTDENKGKGKATKKRLKNADNPENIKK